MTRMSSNQERLSLAEAAAVFRRPLLELIREASAVHTLHHGAAHVQVCVLLSVKTGGCPEDCAYCPQSAHYRTAVKPEPMLSAAEVTEAAKQARDRGATRFCMGAAWREVGDGPAFDRILEMIAEVKALGLEACCTLGMINDDQARRLKAAGLDAYNHNLDTSADFYASIISTRTYSDRLRHAGNVREAGITLCCGGILGMGETEDDRIAPPAHAGEPHPAARNRSRSTRLCRSRALRSRTRREPSVWEMARTIADGSHPDA